MSMTREEAIEELERLLSHWDELENGKRSFRWYSKTALEVALSALRPVSREQGYDCRRTAQYCGNTRAPILSAEELKKLEETT